MPSLENKRPKKKEKLWMMEILLCLIQYIFINYQLCDRHLSTGSKTKWNRLDFCLSEFTFYRGVTETKKKIIVKINWNNEEP